MLARRRDQHAEKLFQGRPRSHDPGWRDLGHLRILQHQICLRARRGGTRGGGVSTEPAPGIATGPVRRVVIAALGITQILAWGSSYYLLAVLGAPIAADTGWSLSIVVGGLSLGLLAGGLASPLIGRTIEARGGRPVLATSSVLLGVGLALLGNSHHLATYLTAWLVL